MPSRKQKIYLTGVWVVASAVLGAITHEFVAYRQQTASIHSFLVLMLFVLLSSLVGMTLIYRRRRLKRETAHVYELMQMQRELDKTARRYKSLMEGAGTAIFVINADSGLLVEVNRQGCELLGYDRDEMKSLRGRDLIPDEEQEKFSSLVRRVIRRGRGRSDGLTFRRKGGDCFLGAIDARLIDLGDEKVVHAIVRDITFRHRAEREIRQRNRELSTLNGIIARANQDLELEHVLDVTLRETIEVFGAGGGGIHLRDPDNGALKMAASSNLSESLAMAIAHDDSEGGLLGRIARAGQHITHADLAEIGTSVGKSAADNGWRGFAGVPLFAKNRVTGVMYIVTSEARCFDRDEMELFLSIGNQTGIVIENARLFNELKWKSEELMSSFRLLEKSSHELAVSQHHLRNNLLLVEKANAELERIDKMKNSFLGMISHEFRTPLTSIMSGTEFLLTSNLSRGDADGRHVLEMIHGGGQRLAEIVSDILKVTRLEANSSMMTKSPVHLSHVFDAVLGGLDPLLRERGMKVVFDNMETLPYFSGDRESLREIFTELLENSIKFTPDGGTILVAARVANGQLLAPKHEVLRRFHADFIDRLENRWFLEVEVRDSGIGINYDEQIKIFDKFYEVGEIRHHSSGKHKFQGKGAGLGLAIVKGMVEAHGGMVWVESSLSDDTPERGSSFFVLLPLEECPSPEQR